MNRGAERHSRSMRRVAHLILALTLLIHGVGARAAQAFDHSYIQWSELLARHVHWTNGGVASVVDYHGFAQEHAALREVLREFSAAPRGDLEAWSTTQRRAFLINAYNAYTIELVLTKYPDLDSIKDLGTVWTSPWRRGFFQLLGETTSLDDIEQHFLRGTPDFDDPRIHFALNCASIGCPALRPEAYVADRLGDQFDDQARRFLADASRNRLDSATGVLTLSKIFQWYRDDFGKGFLDASSVQQFVARYGDALHASTEDIAKLRRNEFQIVYSDYDWILNRAH